MANVLGKTEADLKQAILTLIKDNTQYFSGHHGVFIKKLINKVTDAEIDLDFMSTFDCSELYEKLMKAHHKTFEVFIKDYLNELKQSNKLVQIFDKKLLDAVQA